MAAPEVGDEVVFPTNSDTIADQVDGRTGVIVVITPRFWSVSVEGLTLTVRPEEVQVL